MTPGTPKAHGVVGAQPELGVKQPLEAPGQGEGHRANSMLAPVPPHLPLVPSLCPVVLHLAPQEEGRCQAPAQLEGLCPSPFPPARCSCLPSTPQSPHSWAGARQGARDRCRHKPGQEQEAGTWGSYGGVGGQPGF